jgi:hypothetical protein
MLHQLHPAQAALSCPAQRQTVFTSVALPAKLLIFHVSVMHSPTSMLTCSPECLDGLILSSTSLCTSHTVGLFLVRVHCCSTWWLYCSLLTHRCFTILRIYALHSSTVPSQSSYLTLR